MAEQTYSVEAVARQIIDQIRRDIEAAFLHVEAARRILKSSRWLLDRWGARRLITASPSSITVASAPLRRSIVPSLRHAQFSLI